MIKISYTHYYWVAGPLKPYLTTTLAVGRHGLRLKGLGRGRRVGNIFGVSFSYPAGSYELQ